MKKWSHTETPRPLSIQCHVILLSLLNDSETVEVWKSDWSNLRFFHLFNSWPLSRSLPPPSCFFLPSSSFLIASSRLAAQRKEGILNEAPFPLLSLSWPRKFLVWPEEIIAPPVAVAVDKRESRGG